MERFTKAVTAALCRECPDLNPVLMLWDNAHPGMWFVARDRDGTPLAAAGARYVAHYYKSVKSLGATVKWLASGLRSAYLVQERRIEAAKIDTKNFPGADAWTLCTDIEKFPDDLSDAGFAVMFVEKLRGAVRFNVRADCVDDNEAYVVCSAPGVGDFAGSPVSEYRRRYLEAGNMEQVVDDVAAELYKAYSKRTK